MKRWIHYGMKLRSETVHNQIDDITKELTELQQGLTLMGIPYNDQTIQKFKRYIEILYAFKRKLHLLSHRDYHHIAKRHFLPSLMVLQYIDDYHFACDIGAGAGLPSLPLSIVRPESQYILFESQKKKATFLRYVIDELGLSGVEIIDDRAEHFSERKFDLILLKAVGTIKKLIKTIDNLIEPNGYAVFYKTHRVTDEIRAADKELRKRGFQVQIERLSTPLENLSLALVMLRKR